jgi:hypothetical protein
VSSVAGANITNHRILAQSETTPGVRNAGRVFSAIPISGVAAGTFSIDSDRPDFQGGQGYDHGFAGKRWEIADRLCRLAVAPIVLGHVANHRTTTKAGITLGVYVQHAYEKEKREALELWANRLQGIISGGAEVKGINAAIR